MLFSESWVRWQGGCCTNKPGLDKSTHITKPPHLGSGRRSNPAAPPLLDSRPTTRDTFTTRTHSKWATRSPAPALLAPERQERWPLASTVSYPIPTPSNPFVQAANRNPRQAAKDKSPGRITGQKQLPVTEPGNPADVGAGQGEQGLLTGHTRSTQHLQFYGQNIPKRRNANTDKMYKNLYKAFGSVDEAARHQHELLGLSGPAAGETTAKEEGVDTQEVDFGIKEENEDQ